MANSPKTGPSLALSLAVLIIGTIAASVGGYVATEKAFGQLDAPDFEVPGTYTTELTPGTYNVYLETASLRDLIDGTLDWPDFDAEIVVTNVSTGEIVTTRNDVFEDLDRGFDESFETIQSFTVEDTATYEIEVTNTEPSRGIVTESLTTSWRRGVPWGIFSLIAGLFAFIGFVMLILGVVRRNRAKQASAPAVHDTSPNPAMASPSSMPPAPAPGAPPTSPGGPPPPPT